jgi:hypothetical protein
MGAMVLPLHWSDHSVPTHGARPQESLNKQLVESADIVLALFWHRLGTRTGDSESGTVEEINEGLNRGAHVAILRCNKPVPPNDVEEEQAAPLRDYLASIQDQSLLREYSDDQGLRETVDHLLTHVVSASSASARTSVQEDPRKPADVWPTLERRESTESDNKGRIKTKNKWFLVLTNSGDEPARNVRYELEANDDGHLPHDLGRDQGFESLPPGSRFEVPLFLTMGTTSQANCTVTWEDGVGEHSNMGTIRFH